MSMTRWSLTNSFRSNISPHDDKMPRGEMSFCDCRLTELLNTAPQLAVEPGLVIVVLVLAITLVSDAFRDATAGEGRW